MFTSKRSKVLAAVGASVAVGASFALAFPLVSDSPLVQAPKSHVRYGVNSGGWWKTGGQTGVSAYNDAVKAYGQLGFIRLWPSNFNTTWRSGLVPANVYDAKVSAYINLGSDVAGVNSGKYDAAFTQILKTAPTDRWIWFSFAHEPEGDGFTVTAWQQAQMRLAALKTKYAPANVKFAPLLMGSTFLTNRYHLSAVGNVPWTTWFNFNLTNVDAIGADIYQWGKSDATADTAATVVTPVINAALAKGKGLIIGELGARNTLTDHARATFLKAAVNLFDTSTVTRAVAYFENDNGALGPWNLLPKPGSTLPDLPASIAVWKAAVNSSPSIIGDQGAGWALAVAEGRGW